MSKEEIAASKGNGYINTPIERETLMQMVVEKTSIGDTSVLKKWGETFFPKLEEYGYMVGAPSVKNMSSVRGFVDSLKKGIPTEIRGQAWSSILGNGLRISPTLYEVLLQRVRQCE
jgi:hypothetical protein